VLSSFHSEYLFNLNSPVLQIGVYQDNTNTDKISLFPQDLPYYRAVNCSLIFEVIDGTNSSTILDSTEGLRYLDATILIDSSIIAQEFNITIQEADNILNQLYTNIQTI